VPRRPGRRPAERFLASDALRIEPYPVVADPAPDEWPALNRILHTEFHATVLPRILRNYDLMAMAHGVEVRMPFMDYRLVSYAFSLPPEDKVGGGYTKLVLRKAMAGILLDEVRLRRTKIGFNSPVVNWFQGELRPWLDGVLADGGDAEGLLDVKRLRRYYADEVRPGRVDWDQALRFWLNVNALRLTRLVKMGAQ
jgi:asparagine synthase (glutamine-hydrolysing)